MDASNGNNQANRGRGRQRINMERMENENNLQVTFSKRRAGLFKKANELSTLCGAESAVVVFSPNGKAHSFGHPNVESITNRFLATNEPPAWDPHHALIQQQRNLELVNLEGQVELEKQRKKELEKTRKESGVPPRVQDLSYEQLEELKRSILDFKNQFEAKLDQGHVGSSNAVMDQASSSTSAPAASYDPTFGDIIFDQFMFPNLDDFAVPGVGGAQENGANPDEAPMEPRPDFQGFNDGGFGGYSG